MGGQDTQWNTCVKNDLEAFKTIGDWDEVAKNAVRWCETVKGAGGQVHD